MARGHKFARLKRKWPMYCFRIKLILISVHKDLENIICIIWHIRNLYVFLARVWGRGCRTWLIFSNYWVAATNRPPICLYQHFTLLIDPTGIRHYWHDLRMHRMSCWLTIGCVCITWYQCILCDSREKS